LLKASAMRPLAVLFSLLAATAFACSESGGSGSSGSSDSDSGSGDDDDGDGPSGPGASGATSGPGPGAGGGGPGASGSGGSGACGADQVVCPKGCADLQSDAANCGSCGYACPTVAGGTPVCSGGECSISCGGGKQFCEGACTDTTSNIEHCGACDNYCSAPYDGQAECIGGKCSVDCGPGAVYCSGQCVDPSSDDAHCGACGSNCVTKAIAAGYSANAYCDAGECYAYGDVVVSASSPFNKTCDTLCSAQGLSCSSGIPEPCASQPFDPDVALWPGCGTVNTSQGTCHIAHHCGDAPKQYSYCFGDVYYTTLTTFGCTCAGYIKL
jgi:hypothetical protein